MSQIPLYIFPARPLIVKNETIDPEFPSESIMTRGALKEFESVREILLSQI